MSVEYKVRAMADGVMVSAEGHNGEFRAIKLKLPASDADIERAKRHLELWLAELAA